MAMLCLKFTAYGQENKAIDITAKGIQIGQRVPDITIANLYNYKGADGKPATTAKISDFRDKLLILDFWATWCSPCIAMIPEMDSLQKQFAGKIQFLPIAYQSEDIVRPFLEKLQQQKKEQYDLPEAIGDAELAKLFPHTYLPHYIWINEQSVVVAVTGYNEVNQKNIENYLTGLLGQLTKKTDPVEIPYNKHSPLLIDKNGGNGQNLIYHSLLTSYTEGLPGGVTQYPLDSLTGLKITLRNVPLISLFRTAHGARKTYFGNNRIKLLVKDTSLLSSNLIGAAYIKWLKQGNGYCYELVVPSALAPKAYQIMQEDLGRFFDRYEARSEKRWQVCLVLVRTSENDNLHTAGGKSEVDFDATGCKLQNWPISNLVAQLNVVYMQNSPYPVIDETEYKPFVDLHLQANLSDVQSLNKALLPYGLKLIKDKRKIDVLVISDKIH